VVGLKTRIYLLDDYFRSSYATGGSHAEESKHSSISRSILADERVPLERVLGKP